MAKMTASELIEFLETVDPETEVAVVTQPTYPLEGRIIGMTEYKGKIFLATEDTGYPEVNIYDRI